MPLLRVLSLTAFAWGLATLWMLELAAAAGSQDKAGGEPTRLVFVADLSPSMYLKDAGPDGKQSRQTRMREVVEAILQRVSGNLRFGVIGFYTDSLPVVMEARDPELVRNVFNGLPLTYAMPLGETDLGQAINSAIALVKDYPPRSTRILIFTDGDSVPIVPLASRPASVRDVTFLGLGNPRKGTFIDGHQSRQEPETLGRLAAELKGTYFDANEKQMPTTSLGDLVVTAPLRSAASAWPSLPSSPSWRARPSPRSSRWPWNISAATGRSSPAGVNRSRCLENRRRLPPDEEILHPALAALSRGGAHLPLQ